MKIKIEIEMGNADMQTWGDAARALRRATEPAGSWAENEPHVGEKIKVYDTNGNVVGAFTVSE